MEEIDEKNRKKFKLQVTDILNEIFVQFFKFLFANVVSAIYPHFKSFLEFSSDLIVKIIGTSFLNSSPSKSLGHTNK